MVTLKELFNKTNNKTNKSISLHFKKKLGLKKGIDIDDVLEMEIKSNKNFLK